jgi:hypothetical protein
VKNLILLNVDYIKEIYVYNVLWNGLRKDWDSCRIIKLNINELNNFESSNSNSHKYVFEFLKKYLENNFSCENDFFIDDFSYTIRDIEGMDFISNETLKKDDNSLKVVEQISKKYKQ